jgi:hypothetical protein
VDAEARNAVMRRSLRLILALGCVAAAAGCGSTTSTELSTHVSRVPPRSTCTSYFGGGVAIALCARDAPQALTVTLHQNGTRVGSAPGVGQVMGEPLRDGDKFDIGALQNGGELLVRFRVRSRRALATALYRIPPLKKPQHVTVRVQPKGADVDAELQLSAGKILTPAHLFIPAGY